VHVGRGGGWYGWVGAGAGAAGNAGGSVRVSDEQCQQTPDREGSISVLVHAMHARWD
jgi:hypothetical protein